MTFLTVRIAHLGLVELRAAFLHQLFVGFFVYFRKMLRRDVIDAGPFDLLGRETDKLGEGDIAAAVDPLPVLEEDRRGKIVDRGLKNVAFALQPGDRLLHTAADSGGPFRPSERQIEAIRPRFAHDIVRSQVQQARCPSATQTFANIGDHVAGIPDPGTNLAKHCTGIVRRNRNDADPKIVNRRNRGDIKRQETIAGRNGRTRLLRLAEIADGFRRCASAHQFLCHTRHRHPESRSP